MGTWRQSSESARYHATSGKVLLCCARPELPETLRCYWRGDARQPDGPQTAACVLLACVLAARLSGTLWLKHALLCASDRLLSASAARQHAMGSHLAIKSSPCTYSRHRPLHQIFTLQENCAYTLVNAHQP